MLPKNKQANKFLKYSGLAFQMGATIAIGVFLGFFLDKKLGTGEIFTAICSLVFVIAAIYLGIKDLIKSPEE